MGPVSFRTYRELSGDDRSALAAQVAAQRQRVRNRLQDVGCIVAVLSGKGGVGKSWIATALACGLAELLRHYRDARYGESSLAFYERI